MNGRGHYRSRSHSLSSPYATLPLWKFPLDFIGYLLSILFKDKELLYSILYAYLPSPTNHNNFLHALSKVSITATPGPTIHNNFLHVLESNKGLTKVHTYPIHT